MAIRKDLTKTQTGPTIRTGSETGSRQEVTKNHSFCCPNEFWPITMENVAYTLNRKPIYKLLLTVQLEVPMG